ncbi:glycosyltransferase [Granulicella sp. dw_53]|uniref:glycosyltransferase n=1 Tax=Granulicella sp. dw_53 TaxID=2719792 RepID=UPI001BD5545F|nr:glycosyltransferase [Granulicella sp. dw_53]
MPESQQAHTKLIVIFTIGTQGDVRPCVALGQGLHRAGYLVRIATSSNFAELVRSAGLEFSPLTADFQAMLEADVTIADQGLNLRAMARIFRERYAIWATNWVEEGLSACEGAGLLIGVSNSIMLAKALSEALGIPFAIARLQPLTLSRILPPIMLSSGRRKMPGVLSLGAHYLIFKLLWDVMRPAINEIVRPQLRLPLYQWYGPYFRELHTAKIINGFSSHVLPRPLDWPDSSQVTGYWFLDQPTWDPPKALSQFLAAGSKPIYVGFGSMVSSNTAAFTQTVLDAFKKSGQRAVLATGWGALNGDEGPHDEQIFFLRHAPHDGLFPLMSAAVHHGGAGTTAAAVRAGIPSVIVPFFGDQPFWAHRLNRLGVAPLALERKNLTPDALAFALTTTQQASMLQAAATLGQAVRAEDSIGEALRCLYAWNLLPKISSEAVVQPRIKNMA